MDLILAFALAMGEASELQPMTPQIEVAMKLCDAALKASQPIFKKDAKSLKIEFDNGEYLTCRRNEDVVHERTTRPVQGNK